MKWFYVNLNSHELQKQLRSKINDYLAMYHDAKIKLYRIEQKNAKYSAYYISIPKELEQEFVNTMESFHLTSIEEPKLDKCSLITGGHFFS